jgi:tRNA 2-thiouridine synthesizing protein A
MATVDARGLSCPLPVMMTVEAIAGPDARRLIVLVDSGTAKANVSDRLRDAGYGVEVEQSPDGEYTITATR